MPIEKTLTKTTNKKKSKSQFMVCNWFQFYFFIEFKPEIINFSLFVQDFIKYPLKYFLYLFFVF
jgi:hypothetical protein